MEVSSLDHSLSHLQTPIGARCFSSTKRSDNSSNPANSVYEAMFLEHLDFIERTILYLARRHALNQWDTEDFGSTVKLRLIANDYAVFRKFRGNSRCTTYLTTVLHNFYRDFRIQKWGKWRPSATAKRLGEVAVQLESLLYRDGFGFREATEILRNHFDLDLDDDQLDGIAARLRPRVRRRFESEAPLARLVATETGDRTTDDRLYTAVMLQTATALRKVLLGLDPESKLILRMRFADGLSITAIAGALGIEARRLYPRMRALLTELRSRLEALGVSCDQVLETLDWPGCNICSLLDQNGQSAR